MVTILVTVTITTIDLEGVQPLATVRLLPKCPNWQKQPFLYTLSLTGPEVVHTLHT